MKLLISTALLLLFLASNNIHSQSINLKLKESGHTRRQNTEAGLYKKADLPISLYIIGITSIISPMVVFEDKKVFFAITKEISISKFPYGRISFEYSYVFRDYNRNHLRFSYNYDYVLFAGDFLAVIASPGAGYFTDTKNKGWFLHASAGPLLMVAETFVLHPYLRYRHTFIKDELKSDINDISLGAAFILYF